jgi:hypothetical protein
MCVRVCVRERDTCVCECVCVCHNVCECVLLHAVTGGCQSSKDGHRWSWGKDSLAVILIAAGGIVHKAHTSCLCHSTIHRYKQQLVAAGSTPTVVVQQTQTEQLGSMPFSVEQGVHG